MATLTIDGISYHAQGIRYNHEAGCYEDYELILDCDGEPIPSDICLCHAYTSDECCCGAWDRESYSECDCDWHDVVYDD